MSISNRYLILTVITLLFTQLAVSQPMVKSEGYYIFPIKPGVRNTLAGTMGELRSSHFHTGIDIRTGGQQGLAVLAAADGHVTRIKVSGGGYGYSLYIQHPNGTTTVYAHLKSFRDDIEEYIKEAQYEKQSFEVNLFPRADEFEVKQGDTVALSGNTGSSGGPHLHFDLRDENQDLLNPLSYGFDEIVDTRTPFVKSIALVPFKDNSRINGALERDEINLSLTEGVYTTKDTVFALGEIGLELYAWDRMNGTRFKTGINRIELRVNKERLFTQHIDSWSFSRARSFYQHINYEALIETGKRYHKLYVDNGNSLRFYDKTASRGKIVIEEGKYYDVSITMHDSYGNSTTASLPIYGLNAVTKDKNRPYEYSIHRNILQITGDTTAASTAIMQVNEKEYPISSAYRSANDLPVFIWDLRESIPEKIQLGDTAIDTHIISLVPSRKEYKVFNDCADVLFNRYSLFDSLAFKLNYVLDTANNRELFELGIPGIPLNGSVTAMLKPKLKSYNKEKAAAYQVYGSKNFSYAGGIWKDEQLELKFRSFGKYTILEDSIPPIIKPLIINKERIVFKLDDKLSGIKEVRASVNGNWLLMASDPKRKQYWAEGRNRTDTYIGDFLLEVTDNANNKKTYKTKIK